MLQVTQAKKSENKASVEMEEMCKNLCNEWLLDLSFDEKQIWLWNSLVEMKKVKQRRNF